jgi:hypothetical protein
MDDVDNPIMHDYEITVVCTEVEPAINELNTSTPSNDSNIDDYEESREENYGIETEQQETSEEDIYHPGTTSLSV